MRGDKALREVYELPAPPVSLPTKKRKARKAAADSGHRLGTFKTTRDFNQVACQALCLKCNIEVTVYPDVPGPRVYAGRRKWLSGFEEPGTLAYEDGWPSCDP